VTNLAAIIFAASVMLILAGFRPEGHGRSVSRRLVITLVAVVVVAIPLTLHTRTTIRDASLRHSVANAIVDWDDSVRVVDLDADVGAGHATVDLLVSGPNEPRPAWMLATEIERRFNGPVELVLQYQQVGRFEVSVR
jgi:uncharacterized membrane protein